MKIIIKNTKLFDRVRDVKLRLTKVGVNQYNGMVVITLKDGTTPSTWGDISSRDHLDEYGFIIK